MEEPQEQILDHREVKLTINMVVMRPIHLLMMLMKMSSGTKHQKQQTSGEANINLVTVEERDLKDPLLEV
jgi:hypothetical protein